MVIAYLFASAYISSLKAVTSLLTQSLHALIRIKSFDVLNKRRRKYHSLRVSPPLVPYLYDSHALNVSHQVPKTARYSQFPNCCHFNHGCIDKLGNIQKMYSISQCEPLLPSSSDYIISSSLTGTTTFVVSTSLIDLHALILSSTSYTVFYEPIVLYAECVMSPLVPCLHRTWSCD